MTRVLTVEINTGSRAQIVWEKTRKQIWRPLVMSREDFFRLLPVGTVINEETMERISKY
jgi:hypothetical protein